eukprot:360508-Chlamydomonas_euryale.AAC.1
MTAWNGRPYLRRTDSARSSPIDCAKRFIALVRSLARNVGTCGGSAAGGTARLRGGGRGGGITRWR